jgi:(S)-3,5-dihydroxyphenylglycine transaminase
MINVLNEVTMRFPDAVSFAPGRPYEGFWDLDDIHRYLRTYAEHLERNRGYDPQRVRTAMLQYGPARGIINDLVARNLLIDEGIETEAGAIVVTVGCQEAMFLVLRALRRTAEDVALAVTPTYVGFTGAARLADMPVLPVRPGSTGIDLDDLVTQVRAARARGLRPRICYLLADFANPSGHSIDMPLRRRLLDIAAREDLLLLEDNPYGIFHGGEGERLPTLKALDRARRVVYLGSYAKSGLPGARVGFVVADQPVLDGDERRLLADELATIKSMITLNTSPLAQAVIAGKLLQHGCSMIEANEKEAAFYRGNRNRMLAGLRSRFGTDGRVEWTWPTGGFFVVLTVPFRVDDELLEHSAREHEVIWMPMYHFYGGAGGLNQMRLSWSAVTPDEIDVGLDRLAALLEERMR